jgi:hypothetical protein
MDQPAGPFGLAGGRGAQEELHGRRGAARGVDHDLQLERGVVPARGGDAELAHGSTYGSSAARTVDGIRAK